MPVDRLNEQLGARRRRPLLHEGHTFSENGPGQDDVWPTGRVAAIAERLRERVDGVAVDLGRTPAKCPPARGHVAGIDDVARGAERLLTVQIDDRGKAAE